MGDWGGKRRPERREGREGLKEGGTGAPPDFYLG